MSAYNEIPGLPPYTPGHSGDSNLVTGYGAVAQHPTPSLPPPGAQSYGYQQSTPIIPSSGYAAPPGQAAQGGSTLGYAGAPPPPGYAPAGDYNYGGYKPPPAGQPPPPPPPHHPGYAPAPPMFQQQHHTHTNVVIVGEPTVTPVVHCVQHPVRANDHLTATLVLFILCLIHGNIVAVLLLIPALICACTASNHNNAGNYERARSCGQMALCWDICVITKYIVAVSAAVVVVILLVTGVFFQS